MGPWGLSQSLLSIANKQSQVQMEAEHVAFMLVRHYSYIISLTPEERVRCILGNQEHQQCRKHPLECLIAHEVALHHHLGLSSLFSVSPCGLLEPRVLH